MNKLSVFTLSIAAVFLLNSCKQSQGEKETGVSTDVVGSQAAFSFAEDAHDFGRIVQGEKVSYAFKFTNSGSVDLVISSAHGSCGCTVPEYPKTPIAPGAEGTIVVTFDSDGKSGIVSKTVTIIANTNPNTKVLTIAADIITKEEKKEN